MNLKRLNMIRFLIVILSLISNPLFAAETTLWRVQFDTSWLGPLEAYVEITVEGDELRGRSLSGATETLKELPGKKNLDEGLVVFVANRDGDAWTGSFTAPWPESGLRLTMTDTTIEGSVEGGAFAGSFRGNAASEPGDIRDYAEVMQAFDAVVESRLFDPDDIEQPGYHEFRRIMSEIAEQAADDIDIVLGFHWAWQNDPFSHFQLKRSAKKAVDMIDFFDNYRVGFEAATVTFEDDVAILKVATMMGADTIEQIEAAYEQIAEKAPSTLIIDLRGNGGGAFAVKPLVEHIIDAPLDAGFFISQQWNRDNDAPPNAEQALSAPVWQGWSIRAFWESVQSKDILRVQFRPAEPNFDGKVFVLLDNRSASATELAADALRASGEATLIGVKTHGEMLSQSMFDVAEGFVLSLPVADYYSIEHGRIEGVGVPVDVEVDPEQALEKAKELAGE